SSGPTSTHWNCASPATWPAGTTRAWRDRPSRAISSCGTTRPARWSPRRPRAATASTLRSRRRWRPRERAWTARSVADLLLQVFPAFLLVDRALGGETRFQAIQADLLARIHAVAVLARVHALERAVDLADQLAV